MEILFNFVAAEFPKTPSPKPDRIPPQTPPAGGKSAEATSLTNSEWWCVINKVRTYYEQNPDAD